MPPGFLSLPLELRAQIATHLLNWRDHSAYRQIDSSNHHFLTNLHHLSKRFPASQPCRDALDKFRCRVSFDRIFKIVLTCGMPGVMRRVESGLLVAERCSAVPRNRFVSSPGEVGPEGGREHRAPSRHGEPEALHDLIVYNNLRATVMHLVSKECTYRLPPGIGEALLEELHREVTPFMQFKAALGRSIEGLMETTKRWLPYTNTPSTAPALPTFAIIPSSEVGRALGDLIHQQSTMRYSFLDDLSDDELDDGSNVWLIPPPGNPERDMATCYASQLYDILEGINGLLRAASVPVYRFLWRFHVAVRVVEMAERACKVIRNGRGRSFDHERLRGIVVEAWGMRRSLLELKSLGGLGSI
ncbi:hypothetical protein BJ508DRAFT_379423 [Ascobolus immersus RN42]|uniref:Uncharacterized protein n=1 Tax=Ascobolus immersus RN42 TaxID=1160509 RepID=A0A3N4HRL9_ASCIM|nr:hypothetical protein BJ508DRAFT_379423 [Ascobolus immersus RN42]